MSDWCALVTEIFGQNGFWRMADPIINHESGPSRVEVSVVYRSGQ